MMLTKDMLKKKTWTDEVYYLSVGNDLKDTGQLA